MQRRNKGVSIKAGSNFCPLIWLVRDAHCALSKSGCKEYIFVEAERKEDIEAAIKGIPYAKGVLDKPLKYEEIEHMLEHVKAQINIQKNDIVEIITGPFKREKAKITRIDKVKEEVVVELLESAVPIPITVKIDAVKVIRRESEEGIEDEQGKS